jgi:hypothetical protein
MKTISKIAFVALVCVLIVSAFAVMEPKAVHAVVATLVQVANTSASPVPVDIGPRQAIQLYTQVNSSNFGRADFAVVGVGDFVVPAGQRLVIQQISGYISAPVVSPPRGDRIRSSLPPFKRPPRSVCRFLTTCFPFR